MTEEEALEAWDEARKATQRAREAILRAKEKVREAEAHFQRMYDTERSMWVAYMDAKNGHIDLTPTKSKSLEHG